MAANPFDVVREFPMAFGRNGRFVSLPALEAAKVGRISRLPRSLRIVLESVVRHCDGERITAEHVRQLANWQPQAPREKEIPFVVARIVLQDFTGVPLLCDLAAMRAAAARLGRRPQIVEPTVPVDLVVDHSVQIDRYGSADALRANMALEFQRNRERYQFIKWGMGAFENVRVVPPGIGIVHQVNLEYLTRGVCERDGLYFPDSLVGTDSHTTMINGLGIVGWGVGGIEAEAGMLGQPIHILEPDVVGMRLDGALRPGVTATDLVLTLTQMLREAQVVGKFVEFFGDGVATLSVPDRATIGNMAPEYGATIGYFPVDDAAVHYLRRTGRSSDEVDAFQSYFQAQGMYGTPRPGDIDYTTTLHLDLAAVEPSVAGPRRPQDRIALSALKQRFEQLLVAPASANGFGKPDGELRRRYPTTLSPRGAAEGGGNQDDDSDGLPRDELEMIDDHPTPNAHSGGPRVARDAASIGHGDVLIAAITSCTNTSNPGVLLAAGLLAKHAVEQGLSVPRSVKTSLAPGSRVVTEYLRKTGLLPYLEQLGFAVAAYGCTTCIGNSGPLDWRLEKTVLRHDMVCAAVLSGNRNFEARIHASLKANFLMSPPLVVAFAIAGRVNIDLTREPLGLGAGGRPVFLKDVWPTAEEIQAVMTEATNPEVYRRLYADVNSDNPLWDAIPGGGGELYRWEKSTYIAEPPFFADFELAPKPPGDIVAARALGIFGDSVTTDHISPAGAIKADSPAGRYLQALGVAPADFNSYGSRRGNHEVMMRGTFANVRIRNLMVPPKDTVPVEGGVTLHQPGGKLMSIYDAAMEYLAENVPTMVFAGQDYGAGSSRDWAAKGPRLLGVRAVVARSFERIHRSNLVGMGVLPLQFDGEDGVRGLSLRGDEQFDVLGIAGAVEPNQTARLIIHRRNGESQAVTVRVRIDTSIEADYYRHGGILPYVLRSLAGSGS
ncbi:MAG: aconitate hydratase [Rhodocyclaceae bacterium]|nr:aconitate hydratase [Rhodocyclaceae bacterium]